MPREACPRWHSFHKYLFSTSHTLGPGGTTVSRTRCSPYPQRAYHLVGGQMVIDGSHNYQVRLEPPGKAQEALSK